jgi:hypothetical protein
MMKNFHSFQNNVYAKNISYFYKKLLIQIKLAKICKNDTFIR